jgi:hypothetical protein
MPLDKSLILAADDVKLEKVFVPEWKGDVYLKVLSGTERDQFEDSYSEQKLKNFRVRFLLMTLCNDKGDRLFADNEGDILGRKSSIVIGRLFEKGWALNAFREADVDALGEGSAAAPSEGSTSA